MEIEDLDAISSGGLYSDGSLDVLSLHLGEHVSVEMHVLEDETRVAITGRDAEMAVKLDADDRIGSIETSD